MAGVDPEKKPRTYRDLQRYLLDGGNPDTLSMLRDEMVEDFPFLGDDNNLSELINMFYNGIGIQQETPEQEDDGTDGKLDKLLSKIRSIDHDD